MYGPVQCYEVVQGSLAGQALTARNCGCPVHSLSPGWLACVTYLTALVATALVRTRAYYTHYISSDAVSMSTLTDNSDFRLTVVARLLQR